MAKLKTLIIGKVKDKASIGKARLVHSFSSNSVRYIHLALLKSTTHTSHEPPNSNYISDVISYSNSRYAPTAFAAALWRLRVTKNAFVATKSLIVLHKLIKSSNGKFEGLDRRWDNLKLKEFWDKSSTLAQELSQWIRWYGLYLDHLLWISKVLGSFANLADSSQGKAKEKDCVSSYRTGFIMKQTDFLVSFLEHICTRPETPPLFQNKIVDEIRELVIQDYFAVMILVIIRLQVLSERMIKPGVEPVDDSGLNDLRLVLVRLEECKNSLSRFFWRFRRLAEDFWSLVKILKSKTVKDEHEVVELTGLVHTMVKDDEMMVTLATSGQTEWVTFDYLEKVTDEDHELVKLDSEWVTFDDSETSKDEDQKVIKWDSGWVTFDDANGLTNQSVCLTLST